MTNNLACSNLSKCLHLANAVCVWLILGGASLNAGPPLITDDSGTPGIGGWEVNFSHSIERTNSQFLMLTPLVDINYGLLENDQWKIEFPVIFVDPVGLDERWGVGDIEIGWKYRFLEEDDRGFVASIYPQMVIPTADAGGINQASLGSGFYEMFLPLEVGKQFFDDTLLIYGEVGYNIVLDSMGTNEWSYGVAFQHEHSDRLQLMFEVGGVVAEGSNSTDFAFFNGGWKYTLNDQWSFIGSAGRSFRERRSGAPTLLTFLGLQFTISGKTLDE